MIRQILAASALKGGLGTLSIVVVRSGSRRLSTWARLLEGTGPEGRTRSFVQGLLSLLGGGWGMLWTEVDVSGLRGVRAGP